MCNSTCLAISLTVLLSLYVLCTMGVWIGSIVFLAALPFGPVATIVFVLTAIVLVLLIAACAVASVSIVTKTRIFLPPFVVISVLTILFVSVIICFGLVISYAFSPSISPNNGLSFEVRGSITSSEASFVIRNRDFSNVRIDYGTATTPPVSILESNDFTATIKITGLTPNTLYTYSFIYDNGTETSSSRTFTTLLAPTQQGTFTFTISSCIFIAPYSSPNSVKDLVETKPDFHIHLGDYIYADIPYLLGEEVDDYRRVYRKFLKNDVVRSLAENIQTFHMYDDHEIKNNWDQKEEAPYPSAMKAWTEYAGNGNPQPLLSDVYYYTFEVSEVGYFMLDTKRYRSLVDETDGPSKTMLGSVQKAALFNWLENDPSPIKILMSGPPFSPWNGGDTWGAYRTELNEVLDFISNNNISVVLFSADRHFAAVWELRPGLFEFSVSPVDVLYGDFGDDPPADPGDGTKQLFLDRSGNFFGKITASTDASPPTIKVDIQKGSETVHTQTVTF